MLRYYFFKKEVDIYYLPTGRIASKEGKNSCKPIVYFM